MFDRCAQRTSVRMLLSRSLEHAKVPQGFRGRVHHHAVAPRKGGQGAPFFGRHLVDLQVPAAGVEKPGEPCLRLISSLRVLPVRGPPVAAARPPVDLTFPVDHLRVRQPHRAPGRARHGDPWHERRVLTEVDNVLASR